MAFRTTFHQRIPTHLVYGPGSASRLPRFLSGHKVLVVTDKGLSSAGIVDHVASILQKAGIDHAVYAGVLGNPPARCVNAGHRLYAREKCTALLGLGGGSSMDVAKMIGIVATNGGRIEDYLGAQYGNDKIERDLPFLVCAPTTYGTGSEVTPFAVLSNARSRTKDPVISWKIAPSVGILDAELALALPAEVGAPTGMDALTHALESYVNLLSTPITEATALGAMRLIGANLRRACANDHELEATQNMLIASAMAGLAFSQTRLGNVHAMSHPVGGHFGVHHGLANAILLPYVVEYNLPSRLEKFADIAAALGVDTAELRSYEAAHAAIDAILELNQDFGIPARLAAAGVKAGSIGAMARDAMKSGNVDVNPRKTTRKDLEGIFKKAI